MELLKLIFRNSFRQRLRAALTICGMAVAVLAFCLLSTVVEAWYAGVSGASPNRLVVRNAVSLIFTLPITYRQKIMQVPGVSQVAYSSWFGGIYIDEKQFFPRMAVGPSNFFELFPEFIIPEDQLKAFWSERSACIVGRKLIEKYKWKIGDTIPIIGNIYPGNWDFVLRGVYRGATPSVDETQFLFRWDYLDERLQQTLKSLSGQVGWYIVQVKDPMQAALVSEGIDKLFKNSIAETITETEKAFQLGFVAMTSAIVIAIQVVSYVVIGVILVVLANTMAMSARERTSEYATLKAMGFGGGFVFSLILGESLVMSLCGTAVGVGLTLPIAKVFSKELGALLPIFHVSAATLLTGAGLSLAIGFLAALIPGIRVMRLRIVDGLGHLG